MREFICLRISKIECSREWVRNRKAGEKANGRIYMSMIMALDAVSWVAGLRLGLELEANCHVSTIMARLIYANVRPLSTLPNDVSDVKYAVLKGFTISMGRLIRNDLQLRRAMRVCVCVARTRWRTIWRHSRSSTIWSENKNKTVKNRGKRPAATNDVQFQEHFASA